MNGKTFCKDNQAKTRWGKWCLSIGATLRFEQPGLYHPTPKGRKAAVRPCNAIQPTQQRRIAGLMALHEREARLDFCRPTQQGKSRADRTLPDSRDRKGPQAKQGKLVRPDMAGARQHHRVGNIRASMAAWQLCKMGTASTKNAVLSPPHGQPNRPIRPPHGLETLATSPPHGLIRGVFGHFSSPPHGHLLEIPSLPVFSGRVIGGKRGRNIRTRRSAQLPHQNKNDATAGGQKGVAHD